MNALEQAKPLTAHSVEQQVLGMVLFYNVEAKAVALPLLTLDDFYDLKHRLIYQAIVAINEKGAVADNIAVVELLRQSKQLDGVGGAVYVARLSAVSGYNNLEVYCRVLNEYRTKRQLYAHAQGLIRELELDSDIFDVLAAGAKTFMQIEQGFIKSELRTLHQESVAAFNMLTDRKNNPQKKRVQFGVNVLDRVGGGLEPGDVIVCAARPGIGKTDFLVQFARHNGMEQGIPGCIFSMEMTGMQMSLRFTAAPSGVPANVARGDISNDQLYRLAETIENEMGGSEHIILDARPSLTMPAIRATLIQAKAKFPELGWAALDYVQLVRGLKNNKAEEVIRDASIELKAIAKELGLVILELGQLGREVDTRTPPIPTKADIRASAQLEMDADFIILPWRPSAYGLSINSQKDEIPAHEVPEFVEFIIDKNRHKAPGVAEARYHPAESRFSSWGDNSPALQTHEANF
jgi:replicative DNA helicase